MSRPFDLYLFPDLPPEVVKAFAAQQAALEAAQFEASVERAARQNEQAVVAEKDAFITELKVLIEKLEGQVQDYRRTKFGPKSEKLDPAQLELALEYLETAIAATQAQIAAVEEKIAASATDPEKATPRAARKARAPPESLPRMERVVEPDSIACPCGRGDMVRIGEDRTERLDYIPARYQVIVTVRPKYACPKGRTGVVQVEPLSAIGPRTMARGARASSRRQQADRGASGADCRLQAFRAHAAEPSGRGDCAARGADRAVRVGRLDGPDRRADRPRGRPHGQAPDVGQHAALCRRNHRPGAGPGARQDQNGLPLGGVA